MILPVCDIQMYFQSVFSPCRPCLWPRQFTAFNCALLFWVLASCLMVSHNGRFGLHPVCAQTGCWASLRYLLCVGFLNTSMSRCFFFFFQADPNKNVFIFQSLQAEQHQYRQMEKQVTLYSVFSIVSRLFLCCFLFLMFGDWAHWGSWNQGNLPPTPVRPWRDHF